MLETSLPMPILIERPDQFQNFIETINKQDLLAVDTESNSLYAYQEQVCLIQFSTLDQDFLLDPLALPDLAALRPIFADPAIEKIIHGAEYDVTCLKRDFDFEIINLFDTRVAIRTLGWRQTGLAQLLNQMFEIQINKRFQRANWGRRPLPQDLLDYARLDTHYLIPIRERLIVELDQAGRWQEAREACTYLSIENQKGTETEADPLAFWRIPNARKLKGKNAAVLREVYKFREAQAKKRDRPPFKIMGNKTLLAIAHECPTDLESLAELPGMSQGQIRRYGKDVLAAVSRAENVPQPSPPRHPRVHPKIQERYEALRNWRKEAARKRRVESDVILPREILWSIAEQVPADIHSLAEILGPLTWRLEQYGPEILRLLNGRQAS